MCTFSEGTEVWVRYEDSLNFFRAKIVQETCKDVFTVRYNNGKREHEVPRDRLLVSNHDPGAHHHLYTHVHT